MAAKRIKVNAINLFGPALIFVIALFALEYGQTSLAAFAGILGAATLLIGASTVRVIWKAEQGSERIAIATDKEIVARRKSA